MDNQPELVKPEFSRKTKERLITFVVIVASVAGLVVYSAYFPPTMKPVEHDAKTGVQPQGRRHGNTAGQINQILAQPEALRAVSTIVHEATHQIAFNCGLHTRLSDCPRWLSEGIAMYLFETPDLSSPKGWKSIGCVNQLRLEQFAKYLPMRPAAGRDAVVLELLPK